MLTPGCRLVACFLCCSCLESEILFAFKARHVAVSAEHTGSLLWTTSGDMTPSEHFADSPSPVFRKSSMSSRRRKSWTAVTNARPQTYLSLLCTQAHNKGRHLRTLQALPTDWHAPSLSYLSFEKFSMSSRLRRSCSHLHRG